MMYTNNALEDARKRLAADPALPHRVAAQLRQDCEFARAHHPRGHIAIDAELAAGMAKVIKLAGAERVLELEQLASRFSERVAQAAAQKDRLAQARFQGRLQQDLERQREATRAEWAQRIGKPTLEIIQRMEDRLARLRVNLAGIAYEVEHRDVLADLADAARAAIASVSVEHKSSIERESAANAADKKVA